MFGVIVQLRVFEHLAENFYHLVYARNMLY